jgi:hypothetical protein
MLSYDLPPHKFFPQLNVTKVIRLHHGAVAMEARICRQKYGFWGKRGASAAPPVIFTHIRWTSVQKPAGAAGANMAKRWRRSLEPMRRVEVVSWKKRPPAGLACASQRKWPVGVISATAAGIRAQGPDARGGHGIQALIRVSPMGLALTGCLTDGSMASDGTPRQPGTQALSAAICSSRAMSSCSETRRCLFSAR